MASRESLHAEPSLSSAMEHFNVRKMLVVVGLAFIVEIVITVVIVVVIIV